MGQTRQELAEVARDLWRHLQWAREHADEIPRERSAPPPRGTRAPARTFPSPSSTPVAPSTPVPPPPPSATAPAGDLEAVRADLGDCTRCRLAKGRHHLVFGVGNPRAALVFVGEGPGFDEDMKGEPFVGAAGKLLDKMIEAMGWRREEVYICNVVKCRPPENRDPEPDEVAACVPFLHAQLAAVAPRAVVALGRVAAQTLLGSAVSITRVRGTWHDYRGIRLMPTFHPSYLLRSPHEKRKAWEDLKKVMQEVPSPRPTGGAGQSR